MGRSVSTLNNYQNVIYFDASMLGRDENGELDEILAQMDWEDFQLNLVSELQSKFKSLEEITDWEDEVKIILANNLAEIGISEYCGCGSLSIRTRNDEYQDISGLAANWIDQVWPKMVEIIKPVSPTLLTKVGSFSNGEGVYEKL